MVVTTATGATQQAEGELRRLDPVRDLRAVTQLIGEAFADEMDERGRAALRELRWMARLSPLVWWWAQADPSFQDSFNGFVWEEPTPEGRRSRRSRQIVGNVSLNRAPGNRRRYIICNVVVREAYQGRGIGRQLIEAAVAEAKALGAEGVVLQVYRHNRRALQLYTDLGFQEVTGETDLQLETVKAVAFLDAPGYRLRSWRPADGEAVYQLAHLVTPSVLQWLRPLKAGDYRLSRFSWLMQRLADLLAGRRAYYLSALKGDRLVAMMTVVAAFQRGGHQISLLVHPDHAGQVEAVLVSRALYMLAAAPPEPVTATVIQGQEAVLGALRAYGFQGQRTLLTLRKDFGVKDA